MTEPTAEEVVAIKALAVAMSMVPGGPGQSPGTWDGLVMWAMYQPAEQVERWREAITQAVAEGPDPAYKAPS